MEWKNFDLNLIDKITQITQKHPDHSPFEWFIVGFIYAHPSNNRTLDKIYIDIHTIVGLSKTSQLLTIDDTNGILLKMVQNLLGPRTNHGNLPKKSELSTMETDRRLSEEVKNETNVIEEAPIISKQTKNKLLVPEDISTTVHSPRESTMNSSKEKSQNPKKSELMGNSKPSKLMYDDIDECDISFDSDEHEKKVAQPTKIIEEKPVNQAKPSKSKPEPEPVQQKKTTKQQQDPPTSSKNSTKETKVTELETSFKPKQLPKETKVHDPFEDDISFNSEDDDDLKLTKKNQPAPSKVTKATPAKVATATETITKAMNKQKEKEKKAEQEAIKPAATNKKNIFEEDDFSYDSGDGGKFDTKTNNKGNKAVENKPLPEKKQEGKQSVAKKGEIEVENTEAKITSSSLAKMIQKKSVTKEPPPAISTNKQQYERSDTVITEDVFHSEDDEASRSFILKHSENPNKSFNEKSTTRIAMEEEEPLIQQILMNSDDEDGGSNIAALLRKKDNKNNQNTTKVSHKMQEKDEDDWFALENNVKQEAKATKSFLAGSQESKKKPALKRNETSDDLVINLSDDDNEEGAGSFIRDFSQNSRFRKQKISQEDFQIQNEREMLTSFAAAGKNSYQQERQQPQLSQGMKQKAQQVIDETDAIELIETPPESPVIRKSFAVKRQEVEKPKQRDFYDEEEEEQQIVYSKKNIEDIKPDGPLSLKELKELRDLKKISRQQEDLDKKSEQLAKKMQAAENAKAGKGRSKGKNLDSDDYGRASKRKKQ